MMKGWKGNTLSPLGEGEAAGGKLGGKSRLDFRREAGVSICPHPRALHMETVVPPTKRPGCNAAERSKAGALLSRG